jgi:hypothetical protein
MDGLSVPARPVCRATKRAGRAIASYQGLTVDGNRDVTPGDQFVRQLWLRVGL